jgi:formylglycine-generating enzyme required for sulfatase activity
MYRGHSDGTPANSLASDGSDPYYGTGQSSPSEQRRTLTLANGQTIWDLAGNVYEWNNNTCQIGSGNGYWYNSSGAYIDWTDSNLSDYEKYTAGPSGNYTSANGVGRYYGCSANGNAMRRGGTWDTGAYAGIFALVLNDVPTGSSANFGFRCAR